MNIGDIDGNTPLHNDCIDGQVEVVKIFLENSDEKDIKPERW